MNVKPIVSTTTNRSQFFGQVLDAWGDWVLSHETTYTGAGADPIPTDHGALYRERDNYRLVVTDGLGHHDPRAIGAVAAEVLEEVGTLSLAEQIRQGCTSSSMTEEQSYQNYLKGLARKYNQREGTTLLQLEVYRLGPKLIQLAIGKCGDSDAVVINRKGKVRYATVDTKHHLKEDGSEIGLLAIGANFSERWLDQAHYIRTEVKVKKVFVIACSDGLTEYLRNPDGTIDRERFRHAVLTGEPLLAGETIPSPPKLKLTAAIISAQLREATRGFARRMQEKQLLILTERQLPPDHDEAERRRIHAGDDTTIIIAALPPYQGSQASHSNASSSNAAPSLDPEGSYYQAFEKAYDRNDREGQLYFLEKIAKHAFDRRDWTKSAHLLNAALTLCRDERQKKSLLARLEQLESLTFEQLFNSIPIVTSKTSIAEYRERLVAIRDELKSDLSQNEAPELAQQKLTLQFRTLLCELIQSSIDMIGQKPPTSFAVMALGSMARQEMCPYSDVEFAILIDEKTPENSVYFRRLTQFLAFRVLNLGETKFPLLRPKRLSDGSMREPISLTPSGFSMDIGGLSPLGKAGQYELIDTPNNMAVYQNPDWFARNDGEIILVNALSEPAFVMGDQTLFDRYQEEISTWLNEKEPFFWFLKNETRLQERQQRAIEFLRGSLAEFCPYLEDDRRILRAFNAKKDLYRPIQMAVKGLLLFHGLGYHPTLKGIELLQTKGIFSEEGAQHLQQTLRTALKLRMQTHLFYRKEEEILYFKKGQADIDADKFFLITNPALILETYRVLTALHHEMTQFVNNPNYSLCSSPFYDETFGNLDTQAEEYLNYTAAASSYMQAAALNPENEVALGRLGSIKRKLGEAREAVKHYQEELRILREKYGYEHHPDVAANLNNLGSSYVDLGEIDRAIDYFEQSLAMHKLIHGRRLHPSVATSLHNLGAAYSRLGETARAIDYYEQSLAMKKLIYGDRPHPDVAMSLNNLGMSYQSLNETARALDYHEQSLAMRKLIYRDSPHLDVAMSLNNLGGHYQSLGETARAIDYFEQSLVVYKLIYGDKPHPDVARSLNNLGSAYESLGEMARAIEYQKKSLAMFKLIYEDKPHPFVATSLNNLGKIYQSLSETTQAIDYYEQSLAMKKLIYGDRPHPDVAMSLNNLGSAYEDLGETAWAIDYYERSLAMKNLIYGDKPHPDVATSLNNLGVAYQSLGETALAINYFDWSLNMFKLVYGDRPHPDVAENLNNLGSAYEIVGETTRAIDYFEQSLAMYKLIYVDNPHPSVANSLNNLGMVYQNSNEIGRAIGYFEQSLAMYQLIYGGKPHLSVAKSLKNLGDVDQRLCKTICAIDYLEQSLAMYKLIYGGKPHLDVAANLNSLGGAYKSLGETVRTIDYYEQSLAIFKLIYGDKPHPDVATSLNNLGSAYEDLGETIRAIDYYEQSLTMYKLIYGDRPHPDIAMSLNNLGMSYQSLNETALAIDYFEQSLAMRKLIYGDKPHPDVAMSLNNLGGHYQSLGETARAIAYYEQSLVMKKLIYGDKPHTDIAGSLNNLGGAYESLGEMARAIDYLEQAVAMFKLIYRDRSHPSVATSLNNLGNAYEGLGEMALAIDNFEQSLVMRKLIYGDKPHLDVATSLNRLGTAYWYLGETVLTIDYLEQSLAMFNLIYENKPHPHIAISLHNLGSIYERFHNYPKACEAYQKVYTIYQALKGNDDKDTRQALIHFQRIKTALAAQN